MAAAAGVGAAAAAVVAVAAVVVVEAVAVLVVATVALPVGLAVAPAPWPLLWRLKLPWRLLQQWELTRDLLMAVAGTWRAPRSPPSRPAGRGCRPATPSRNYKYYRVSGTKREGAILHNA